MFYVKRGLVLSQAPLFMPLCDWDEAVLRLPKAMRTMNIRDGHTGQGDPMPYLLSCDIHTHTMFSAHAYSTIEENIYWAAERGLQVLGSADHLSSMVTPCPNDLRSFQFFINQDIWPRIWSGVLVLRGAEADIVSLDGSLFGEDIPVSLDIAGDSYSREHSLFDLVTRNLDYLVASVHNPQLAEGATLAQTTEMYINALEHPKVFTAWAYGSYGRAVRYR